MKPSIDNLRYQLGVNDPISLNDPVWTLEHIALFLRKDSLDSVRPLVHSGGFPVPLDNVNRNRRWLAPDVMDYFEKKSQGHFANPAQVKVNPHQTPKSIRFKSVKDKKKQMSNT